MLLHRFGGIALTLLMIQLTLVRGEMACPRHDSGAAAPAHHQTGSTEHHGGHEGNTGPSAPDEGAPLPDCCQAMTACAGAVAVHAPGETLIAQHATDARLTLTPSLFVSRVETPDPPPPKA